VGIIETIEEALDDLYLYQVKMWLITKHKYYLFYAIEWLKQLNKKRGGI